MSERRTQMINQAVPSGFVYTVTVIGAAFYFLQHVTTLWGVIVGLLEAVVWPAFVVYHVLQMLGV